MFLNIIIGPGNEAFIPTRENVRAVENELLPQESIKRLDTNVDQFVCLVPLPENREPRQPAPLQYTLRAGLTPQEIQQARDAERQMLEFFQHIQTRRNGGERGLIDIDANRIEAFNTAMERLAELTQGQVAINLNNPNLFAETRLWAPMVNDDLNVHRVYFRNCRFQSPNGRVNFAGSDFSYTAFAGCSFENAIFASVVAQEAAFSRSNFTGANLSGSDFSDAGFADANLGNANCAGANFSNARLQGTNLNTNLLGGCNFNGAQYGRWTYGNGSNRLTIFPQGFNPVDRGMAEEDR